MKTLIASTKNSQKQTLTFLLEQHLELKALIDTMFSQAWNSNSIEPLLEIRSLNSKTISKYRDLFTNQALIIEKSESKSLSIHHTFHNESDLWEINAKLAKMIPIYKQAISNVHLSSFVRMLISITMEKMVLVKENLLHPVKTSNEALSA